MTLTYEEIGNNENSPAARAWQTANLIGRSIFIYGGLTNGNIFSSELLRFNLDTHIWEVMVINGPKASRYGHESLTFGSSLIILGGVCPEPEKSDILEILDESFTSSKILANADKKQSYIGLDSLLVIETSTLISPNNN